MELRLTPERVQQIQDKLAGAGFPSLEQMRALVCDWKRMFGEIERLCAEIERLRVPILRGKVSYCIACFFPRGEIDYAPHSSIQVDDGMEPGFSEIVLRLPLVAAGVIRARVFYAGQAKPPTFVENE